MQAPVSKGTHCLSSFEPNHERVTWPHQVQPAESNQQPKCEGKQTDPSLWSYFYLTPYFFLGRVLEKFHCHYQTGFWCQGTGLGGAVITAIVISTKVISDGVSAWDKWLPIQASLHPATAMFGLSHHFWSLNVNNFLKLQTQRGSATAAVRIENTKHTTTAWVQIPA